jgi:hypothetical protein
MFHNPDALPDGNVKSTARTPLTSYTIDTLLPYCVRRDTKAIRPQTID